MGASEWREITKRDVVTYGIINVKTKRIVTRNFITDGTETDIRYPYSVSVNPITKDIYVCDARNKITPGYLYCYDKNGVQKWRVRTGDIPASICLLGE